VFVHLDRIRIGAKVCVEEGKPKNPEKTLGVKINDILNQIMTRGQGSGLGTLWSETSTLATTPPLYNEYIFSISRHFVISGIYCVFFIIFSLFFFFLHMYNLPVMQVHKPWMTYEDQQAYWQLGNMTNDKDVNKLTN